jgi:hypothetical protein
VADASVWEPLRRYVDATSDKDLANVADDWAEAVALLTKYLTENDTTVEDIDPVVWLGAVVDCGSELFHRRNAPFGVTTFATGDGAVGARVSVDPAVRAKTKLADFLKGVGFG